MMRKNKFFKLVSICLSIILTLFSLVACSNSYPISIRGLEINTRDTENKINIDTTLLNINNHIQQYLPDAYVSSFSYDGNITDIELLYGELTITYLQVDDSNPLLNPLILRGIAVANLENGNLDITIIDVSNQYPNINTISPPTHQDFHRLVNVIARYLNDEYVKDGVINIYAINSNWNVEIYSEIDNREYMFGIDVNMEITDYYRPR